MTGPSPFHLLEINLISAQDIAKVSQSMKTYAVAWVHPQRKLSTRVDNTGDTHPTWNDKFVFRVHNNFLQSNTSAIMIEIYSLSWFRDTHIGTVRVLVGNLITPQSRSHNQTHIGMRFVALQVRRPSGRPQGILYIGVTIVDSTMRSLPLAPLAVGYQQLMGEEELFSNPPGTKNGKKQSLGQVLGRTRSTNSSMIGDDHDSIIIPKPNNSIINASEKVSIADNKKGKIIYDKPLSIIEVEGTSNLSLAVKLKAQPGKKAESVIGYPTASASTKKPVLTATRSDIGVTPPLLRKNNNRRHNWLPNYVMNKDFGAGSIWSDSEVGPSPSVVAAAIKEDKKVTKMEGNESSVIMNKKRRSFYDSEGRRTRLERWRSEIPAASDYGGSYVGGGSCGSSVSSIFPKARHIRRHTTVGGGGGGGGEGSKFSCFGNICGYECSIVCGRDNDEDDDDDSVKGGTKRKYIARAPSFDSVSTAYL